MSEANKKVPWAEIARNRKVENLVSALRGRNVSADEAAAWIPARRNAFAHDFGVNPPSETTWTLVVEKVARLERGDDRDPFEGLL